MASDITLQNLSSIIVSPLVGPKVPQGDIAVSERIASLLLPGTKTFCHESRGRSAQFSQSDTLSQGRQPVVSYHSCILVLPSVNPSRRVGI